jgi:hypothetical protein
MVNEFGKTQHGHKTKKPIVVPTYEGKIPEKDWWVSYSRGEYDQQIERMKKLGINVDAQTFEQCVNTALWMLERNKIKL